MGDIGSEVLLKFGSKEQKEQFLIPLATGTKRMGVAFGESEDGSDFSSISTVSLKRGEIYSLQGKKRFVLNASLMVISRSRRLNIITGMPGPSG